MRKGGGKGKRIEVQLSGLDAWSSLPNCYIRHYRALLCHYCVTGYVAVGRNKLASQVVPDIEGAASM